MPLSSMVTGTFDGAGPGGPQQGEPGGGSNYGSEANRVAKLESRIAELEGRRERLLAERRDVVTRYERLLREAQETPRRTETPDDDGLALRIARRLGLR